jgi:hypothetical protein
MVPVHGASQYRYTLHLTRGRDLDRPAAVVLLDSDPAGVGARRDLEKGYSNNPIIDEELIFAIGDIDPSALTLEVEDLHEPEDLIPISVALTAVAHFARAVLPPDDAQKVTDALPVDFKIDRKKRLYDQITKVAADASKNLPRPLTIGKIEFARAVADVIPALSSEAKTTLFQNFSALFEELNRRQGKALRLSNQERLGDVTRRLVERFRRDHRTRAQKYTVERFLQEVEQHLEGPGREEETLRAVIRGLRSDFKLDLQPLSEIDDFPALRGRLSELVYRPTREFESA